MTDKTMRRAPRQDGEKRRPTRPADARKHRDAAKAGKGRGLPALLSACAVLLPGLPAAAQPAVKAACGGPPGASTIQLSVEQVRNGRGLIAATLYPDSAKRFLAKGAKVARSRVPTTAGTTTLCLNAPGPGYYALAVYHDADGDKDYDRNAVGMPTEGYAFSNDAPTRLGLPAFSAVRFRIGPGANTVRVRMRYP